MFCFFESSDSGFTRYGGKPLEKLFERLSTFQIVEESLDWHSRSAKHRSSAKNVRVFDDNSHERIVSRRVGHPNRRGKNRTSANPSGAQKARLKTAGCAACRHMSG